jgi:hypothetical protein
VVAGVTLRHLRGDGVPLSSHPSHRLTNDPFAAENWRANVGDAIRSSTDSGEAFPTVGINSIDEISRELRGSRTRQRGSRRANNGFESAVEPPVRAERSHDNVNVLQTNRGAVFCCLRYAIKTSRDGHLVTPRTSLEEILERATVLNDDSPHAGSKV